MHRRPVADDFAGIPIGRSRTVQEFARGNLPRAEVAVRNQVMRARDRRPRIRGAVRGRPVLRRSAKQTIPPVLDIHNLRNFQLTEPSNVHGFVQSPAHKVLRASQANRPRVVRLFNSCRTGREVHDPAVAVRVAHHPRVAHRAIMPATGRILFVNIKAEIQDRPLAATGPFAQIRADCTPDALLQTVLAPARPGVEQMPKAVGVLHYAPRPSREVVPSRTDRWAENLACVRPIPQIA